MINHANSLFLYGRSWDIIIISFMQFKCCVCSERVCCGSLQLCLMENLIPTWQRRLMRHWVWEIKWVMGINVDEPGWRGLHPHYHWTWVKFKCNATKKKPENLSNQTSKIIKTDGEEWKNVLCRRPSARSTFQREQELDSTRYLSTEALLWASVALFKSHSFTVT